MPTLEQLRASLNPFQQELLDEIVETFLATDKGPVARVLHMRHDKEKVVAALKAVGGSALFEVEDYQHGNRYEPKLLGMLLSSKGPTYQDLLARFAGYVESEVRKKPERNTVDSAEVAAALSLAVEESRRLYKLILAGYLLGRGGGSCGPDGQWKTGVFDEVDELGRWPDRLDFAAHVALRHYDPNEPVIMADRRAYPSGLPTPITVLPRLPFAEMPILPRSPSVTMSFDYEPDYEQLVVFVSELASTKTEPLRLVRHFRDFQRKVGNISGDSLRKELPELAKLDLDFLYKPGNEDVGGWASVDLEFTKKTARVRCQGDYDWFRPCLNLCIERLALRKTAATQLAEFVQKAEASLSPALFGHIKGSLRDGNHPAALSAAVVFIEDRLRTKLNGAGTLLTGADLVLHAFKNPGVLTPPLALAGNPEDNAYLLMRGWFGLVRNLHGHQTSIPLSHDEAFAQLAGANYVLWLIENSAPVAPRVT
ncbi:MAG TPA: TIGR02391 family protein [Lacunisphaera sp.]|nr:TIGR02391 family protein [Lacunisphaera sp.]